MLRASHRTSRKSRLNPDRKTSMQFLVCAQSNSEVQPLQGDSMLMRNATIPISYTSHASLHVSSTL